ncbi:MAG: HupE/UreJ family protein [Ferruginibacter sp.]|nr:HupE/UreJ family protein [Cytophagales bacterium]
MTEFEAYFRLGFKHITDTNGYDHILFIIALCAVYYLKDWRRVLLLVTAFTFGHSVTLALSTLNIVVVRSDVIEFLIPVTILATAIGNFFYRNPSTLFNQAKPQYLRYLLALVFGFIHGLGFSNYLKSLLGASTNVVTQLLAFNLGLEIGQVQIVLVVLILGFLVTNVFKVRKHNWNLVVSGVVAGMALSLILRIDFL